MQRRIESGREVTSWCQVKRVSSRQFRKGRRKSVNVEYIIISLIKELSNPELDCALAATGEDPGLGRVELAVHCTKTWGLVGWMRLQYLDWNDKCILEQIIEDHSVEDIHWAIITAWSEERVLGTELHLTNGLIMILQVLIGRWAHIHVKPDDLLVISTKNKVITLRMNGDRWDPFGSRLKLGNHRLLLQVVLEHSLMSCNEEVRLGRVELHSLDYTLGLSKGSLRRWFWEGVNDNLGWWLHILGHCCEIISLRMPYYSLDDVLEGNLDHFSSVNIWGEWPLPELFFLII